MKKTAIITGATGFLGSHFLVNKVSEEYETIYTIVRGASEDEARNRLHSIIQKSASSYPSQQSCIDLVEKKLLIKLGDIEQKMCGLLDDKMIQPLEGTVDVFWHFAASLAFEDHKKDQIYQQNVIGVQNALDLALRLKIKRFIYFSTAYTVGKSAGAVEEKLHAIDGPFNNYYERTKCQAEHIVKDFCTKHGIAFNILRPSIVIGPAINKQTGGSSTGLYGFVREVIKLKAYPKGVLRQVRMHGESHAEVNLIPIDFLMHDVHSLVCDNFGSQEIYHLSADGAVSLSTLVGSMKEQLDLDELVISDEAFNPESRIEQQFAKRTVLYDGYIKNTKQFIRKLPSEWAVNKNDANAFIKSAISELLANA